MTQRILFCMTSNFAFDQRMQRIVGTLHASYEVSIYNRFNDTSDFGTIYDAACFFNRGFLFYLEFNIRLLYHLLTKKYDIVYLVDADTLLAGGISSYLIKRKYVFDSHEWFAQVPELQGQVFKQKIWEGIQSTFVKKMDLCITVNQSLSIILSRAYSRPFTVIRNVPKIRSFASVSTEHTKIIIYQGAVNKGRGLDVAIEAMKSLPLFQLHIYGEGGVMHELQQIVKSNDLEDRVLFFGNQRSEVLWQKTTEAYIGLNLLEADSLNYYYSLANKFFDYMHAEVPSINMDFPEYNNIIDKYDFGLLLENLDRVSLIDAIRKLDNEAYRKTLIDNCKKYREQFSWDIEQNKLIEAINGLANN